MLQQIDAKLAMNEALRRWSGNSVDGIDLHYIHEPGVGPEPMPLLLCHGWPGSVLEFLEMIPMLTDPARYGGDPDDAFTIVAPSLPGYPLSYRPGQARFGAEEIAKTLHTLMHDVLGHDRFGAQGGDWGSLVSTLLGLRWPSEIIGIHLNMLSLRRDAEARADPSDEERAFYAAAQRWLREEGGYQSIDRIKDRIRRRGENISAFEIEEVLSRFDPVDECAAVGIRVEGSGGEDEIKACVVAREGATIDHVALLNFCVARMPRYAVPRFIEILAEVPKTASGKVQRQELRNRGVSDTTFDRETIQYAIPRG